MSLDALPPVAQRERALPVGSSPPLPLAAAARRLRDARVRLDEQCPPNGGHSREALSHLRGALHVYVRSLEHLELPVASKLQQEMRLLDTLEDPRSSW